MLLDVIDTENIWCTGVVKQIFDNEKYDLILQDASFVSNRVDITKKVIDALNAQK